MVEYALIVVLTLLFFSFIIIYLLYKNIKGQKALYVTLTMCEINNEYIKWFDKNKDKCIEDPEHQDFIRRRIIALVKFMKTHRTKSCDDNFEGSLNNLLDKLVDKAEFVVMYKKLLKGLYYNKAV